MAMLDFRKTNKEIVEGLSEGGKALIKGNGIPKLQDRIKEFYNDYLENNTIYNIKHLGNGASKKAFTGTEFLKWYHVKHGGISYKFSHGIKKEIILPLVAEDIIIKIEMSPKDAQKWGNFRFQQYAELLAYEKITNNKDNLFFVPIFLGFVGKGKLKSTKGYDSISLCLRVQEVSSIDNLIKKTSYTKLDLEEVFEEYNIHDIWGHGGNGGIYEKNGKLIPCIIDFGL